MYAGLLGRTMDQYEINTVCRAAHFIGQLAHESGDLRYWEELASGDDYEGRHSLGNTQPGDGRRFKGRGPIQLTGRNNYTEAAVSLGVDIVEAPELVASPVIGFRVAGWYWTRAGCNALADVDDVHSVTKAINGGYRDLDKRFAATNRAKDVLVKTAMLR